ncbi:ankycorbin-like isoform X6 [Mya arenaria]|uniref:ankycorbin-like isoform X6 n=1 Tax=Mya arenaria TaxID=6604 RepID=UPI0022E90940|nr:ankycorbin-like isoform X6 [Mya arenaria]
MSKKEHKPSKMKNLFRFRKSTTDLSEWSKNDEKLMKATEGNDAAKIDELLRKKTLNPTKLGPKGLSVFHVACTLGHYEVVELLISHGAEVNVLSIQGNTSVQIAARDGHPKILEKLIEAGGVIDHKDGMSLTALHHACVRGKLNCVQILLKHRADPNSRDKTGKPPLFYAAFSEDLPICKELVEHGANVNFCDENDITPLMAAAKKGSVEICEFLLRKGANARSKDKSGNDALAYGMDSGFTGLQEVFDRAPTTTAWSVTPAEGAPAKAEEAQADKVEDSLPVPVAEIPDHSGETNKDLEEENASMNEDLKRLVGENKRLQEAYTTLKKQLSTPAPPPVDVEEVKELEDELTSLKNQLTEEQDKNVRLIDRVHKIKKKFGITSESVGDSGDDSWNDSDEELFDSSSLRKPAIVDHKPQTLLLLQNQVAQLKQDNRQLRDRLKKNGTISAPTLFGRATGSVSSLASLDELSEGERLRRKLEDAENDKLTLQKKLQESNVFPEDQLQNMQVLEKENSSLHSEVKQLRIEVTSLRQEKQASTGEGGEHSAISTENSSAAEVENLKKESTNLKAENELLNEELESLRETYSKLVVAGDNLQDMYDTLVTEKEQLEKDFTENETIKQQLAKENEYLLADGNSMHADIDSLVAENEALVKNMKELEKKLSQGGKASDFARVTEERDQLLERVEELEGASAELKQNYEVLCEEVESLQTSVQHAQYERDQIQQEFDSLQDEFEGVQVSSEALQQDYSQLEHEYSSLLADKEKLEQEYLDVQTASVASVSLEHHSPALAEERDRLQQDLADIAMEKEQLEMTTSELSKANALLNEELSTLKDSLKLNEDGKDKASTGDKKAESVPTVNGDVKTTDDAQKVSIDAVVEKDRRIRSLQIQISRLQQQIADQDRHFKEVISTYRTHLLSAVQGHMDPDVKQALYNIIELRSMEQYC